MGHHTNAGLTWDRVLRPGKTAAFRSRLFFGPPDHDLGG